MDDDFAYTYLLERLKAPAPRDSYDGYSNYGYDVYLPRVIEFYARERDGLSPGQSPESSIEKHWPAFADAAWRLCMQGILRPSVRRYREQSTADGSAGNGYAVTSYGKRWLQEQRSKV
jgi:hypothetical protein